MVRCFSEGLTRISMGAIKTFNPLGIFSPTSPDQTTSEESMGRWYVPYTPVVPVKGGQFSPLSCLFVQRKDPPPQIRLWKSEGEGVSEVNVYQASSSEEV